ncbi:abortive infection family protein [Candidatus Magnetaquiglobus chichijimensis]|uniref:abortive infection family protein n=1 Tax=Candidatus Magnetaquiglobus chichijimensis TaxID=3141448 RepID=UPI003B96CF2E
MHEKQKKQIGVTDWGYKPISDAKKSPLAGCPLRIVEAQCPQGMAELQNLYGTGHSPSAKTNRGIQPGHARLATGVVAATLASFLFETHLERNIAHTSHPVEVA